MLDHFCRYQKCEYLKKYQLLKIVTLKALALLQFYQYKNNKEFSKLPHLCYQSHPCWLRFQLRMLYVFSVFVPRWSSLCRIHLSQFEVFLESRLQTKERNTTLHVTFQRFSIDRAKQYSSCRTTLCDRFARRNFPALEANSIFRWPPTSAGKRQCSNLD